MLGEVGYRAIDKIAGDGDEIGMQAIYGIDNGINVRPLYLGADVHIADLRDGESPQCKRQIDQWHLDVHDPGTAASPRKAHQCDKRGEPDHRQRRRTRQCMGISGGQCNDRQEQDQIAQQGQYEQRGKTDSRPTALRRPPDLPLPWAEVSVP